MNTEQTIKNSTKAKLEELYYDNLTDNICIDDLIAYATEEELNSPQIQKQFLKHGYIAELIEMVEIIKDNEVIREIFESEIFKDTNTTYIEGHIESIKFACESESNFKNENDTICHTIINFKENDGQRYRINGHVFTDLEEVENYKNRLSKYNNIGAIVENRDKELYIKCYIENNKRRN